MRLEYIFMDLDGTISDPKEGINRRIYGYCNVSNYYNIVCNKIINININTNYEKQRRKNLMVLNIVQPAIIILLIIATILFIYLGKELKRSYVVAIPLIGYIILLLTHIFEIITLSSQYIVTLILCIIIDCIFICVSLIVFLLFKKIYKKRKF